MWIGDRSPWSPFLVLLVRMNIDDQRGDSPGFAGDRAGAAAQSRKHGNAGSWLGSLTAPLANPLAFVVVINHVIGNGANPAAVRRRRSPARALVQRLAGCCWGLCVLLTRGTGGIRWHLAASRFCHARRLSAIFYFAIYGSLPGMHELAIWLSLISAAAITFPVARRLLADRAAPSDTA